MTERDRQCPDDLRARAQRQAISELEGRALSAHLSHCESCRAAVAMSAMFEETPGERPGDGLMIARLGDGAARRSGAGRPPPWRLQRIAVAAALGLFFVATAGAAWIGWQGHPVPPRSSVTVPRVAVGPSLAVNNGEELVPSSQAASAHVSAAKTRSREHRPAMRAPTPRPEAQIARPPVDRAETAASLFASANAVRRSGDLRRAVDLYQDLRRRFPEAGESVLASISVGDLLLGLDDPRGALAAFDFYLGRAPAAPLSEEALFGKGRCLRQLGRVTEEREVWRRLIGQFPGSAYEGVAHQRLKALQP